MKTKKIVAFCAILISFGLLRAQEDDLPISVVVPAQIEGLTQSHISKLESRLQKMVSNYGIAGEGYSSKFIIYPKYELYEHNVVEGLRNVHLIDVEISFFVKEVKTRKVYSVLTQEITADGYSKKEAINQSISKIKTKGDTVEHFLKEAKAKILDYYRANCDRLHSEANTMVKQKRYSEAIALLYPVPKEVGGDCYKKIQKKLDEAYNGYLNKTCEKNLVKAKAEMSKNNNKSALNILASIETESNCHASAQKLKAQIKVKNNKTPEREQVTESRPIENNRSTATVSASNSPSVNEEKKKTPKVRKRKKMRAIAKAEFNRTRHQGEIDKAIQES